MSDDKKNESLRRLLIKSLNELVEMLEVNVVFEDGEPDFSGKALEAVRFVKLYGSNSLQSDDLSVSRFGMGLLMLELSEPVQALEWWRRDIEFSKVDMFPIGEEEAEAFKESFEAKSEQWLQAYEEFRKQRDDGSLS